MQSLGQCAVSAINAIALGILFDDILQCHPIHFRLFDTPVNEITQRVTLARLGYRISDSTTNQAFYNSHV